jgi:hypothetical protein
MVEIFGRTRVERDGRHSILTVSDMNSYIAVTIDFELE